MYKDKVVYVLRGIGQNEGDYEDNDWTVGVFSSEQAVLDRKDELEDLFDNCLIDITVGEYVRKHPNGDRKAKDDTQYYIEKTYYHDE